MGKGEGEREKGKGGRGKGGDKGDKLDKVDKVEVAQIMLTLGKNWLLQPRSRKIAIILALVGTVTPIAGLHKFYLKQYLWGVIYLLLSSTPISSIASAIDAVWYLAQDHSDFHLRFNLNSTYSTEPLQVQAIADALRQLDELRTSGLITEYEFEQKRRKLLERIV